MPALALERNVIFRRSTSYEELDPSYLLVRLRNVAPRVSRRTSLSEALWSLLEEHFTYRLVLDLEGAGCLDETDVEQLMTLARRLITRQGTLRLCGPSAYNREVLEQLGVMRLHTGLLRSERGAVRQSRSVLAALKERGRFRREGRQGSAQR